MLAGVVDVVDHRGVEQLRADLFQEGCERVDRVGDLLRGGGAVGGEVVVPVAVAVGVGDAGAVSIGGGQCAGDGGDDVGWLGAVAEENRVAGVQRGPAGGVVGVVSAHWLIRSGWGIGRPAWMSARCAAPQSLQLLLLGVSVVVLFWRPQ